jgi:hypothetical protein
MRIFWLFLFGFFSVPVIAFAQEYNILEVRELLTDSGENKEKSTKLYDKIGNYSGDNAVLIAYKAAAYALKAKYATNPFKKLKFIKTSSKFFDEAVQRDDKNLEIRFVRFAVETKTPAKVNLSKHVEEDKNILIQAIRDYPKSGIEPDLARKARDFLKQYCKCSEEEVKTMDEIKLD